MDERLTFTASDKKICLYPCAQAERAPMICLNGDQGEGEAVIQQLQEKGTAEFSLVVIEGLDWNRDLAPWDCPPVSRRGEAFTAGADAYLTLMTEKVLPKAEELLCEGKENRIPWRGLAGYSLAGLFAVYALCRTNVFSRVASCSGSLRYPDFACYALSHELYGRPERIYLSLGDKEAKTRNVHMQSVQENTEQLAAWFAEIGIDTKFELNPGGHFADPVGRIARGILALLTGSRV